MTMYPDITYVVERCYRLICYNMKTYFNPLTPELNRYIVFRW